MIDSITLKIPTPIMPKDLYRRTESFSGYKSQGRVKNLILTTGAEYSTLSGSLPKYLRGSNVKTLDFGEINLVINQLENELQCDIANAEILTLDWSTTIQTDNPPKTYYSILGETHPYHRVAIKNSLYFNGLKKKVLFYDKGKEAGVSGNNLRCELRLPKAKNMGLTLQKLTGPESFNSITSLWYQTYLSINKLKRLMPKEVKTPKDLNRFLISVAYEALGGRDAINEMITNLHRQGKVNDYNKTRMKQGLYSFEKNIAIPTDMEEELNEKFLKVATDNTITN